MAFKIAVEIFNAIKAKLKFSRLQWHNLRSVEPVSRKFGFERGTPIDRYYIQAFLNENRSSITGKVLEVADNHYSKKYGNQISSYEVLHVEPSSRATIIGDLSKPESLPENFVDCFICTQVFNFIYDFNSAIQGSYKILKPGGTLIATVGGISQISRHDADRWGHFWSFYPQGIEHALADVFGIENVEVKIYGNSLSAISFIKGIAAEELTSEELNYVDGDYPITIALIAKKR